MASPGKFNQTRRAVLELKHADNRRADTMGPICANFMHSVQRMHKRGFYTVPFHNSRTVRTVLITVVLVRLPRLFYTIYKGTLKL
jgi:hypothetical protein